MASWWVGTGHWSALANILTMGSPRATVLTYSKKKSKFRINLLGGNYHLGRQELTCSSGRIIHTLQPTAVRFHGMALP